MARILIVDDDQQMREILTLALVRAGYEVDAAEDGRCAFRLSQENPPDLVVTDLFMPEHDGLQLLMDLRRARPGLKVIAISGFTAMDGDGEIEFLTAAQTFGAVRVFKKPFGMADLVQAVGEALEPA